MTTARAAGDAVRRVAILGSSDLAILRNRDSLIRDLVERRRIVLTVAPALDPDCRRGLNLLGAETVAFDPPHARFGILDAWQRSRALSSLIGGWHPDAVLAFDLPMLTEVAIAAGRAKTPRIVALLNTPLDQPGPDGQMTGARRLAAALRRVNHVIAHNTHLLGQAKSIAGAGATASWSVVPGAGVDLAHHAVAPLPGFDNGLVFLMIARLNRRQGVLEFAEAARQLHARGRRARFAVIGTPDSGPDAVTSNMLAPYAPDIEVLPPVDDVRPHLASAHVYVHAAYAEGMPRTLAEALAAGRPMIATDIPGCREAVDERVNGCLVPPRDAGALTLAIESTLKRPDLIPSQARASRLKAERRFDVRAVNRVLLDALGVD